MILGLNPQDYPLGWIYFLPSETTRVIIKYYPKWMISCFLPNSSKRIFVSKYEEDTDSILEREACIKVPSLLISHTLPKPWISESKIDSYFNIYAIDESNKLDICTKPYRLANVYSSGSICFGEIEEPYNLRQANNYFWASIFNEDNCPYLDNHYQNCKDRQHDHYDEERIVEQVRTSLAVAYSSKPFNLEAEQEKAKLKCSCCLNECGCSCGCDLTECFYDWINNYYEFLLQPKFTINTKLFCGEKYFECVNPLTALFITNNKNVLEKISEHSLLQDCKDTFIIGQARYTNNKWEIEINNHKLSLLSDEIEVI